MYAYSLKLKCWEGLQLKSKKFRDVRTENSFTPQKDKGLLYGELTQQHSLKRWLER